MEPEILKINGWVKILLMVECGRINGSKPCFIINLPTWKCESKVLIEKFLILYDYWLNK